MPRRALSPEAYQTHQARYGRAVMPQQTVSTVKHSKYRNVKTTEADSGKEQRLFDGLRLRELAGEISELKLHPRFLLLATQRINGVTLKRSTYVADASYREKEQFVVIDAKSPATRRLPAFRLKVKLMAFVHGILVTEV